MTYDNLNRLHTGVVSANTGPYSNLSMYWTSDSFGNRAQQSVGGNVSAPVPLSSWAHYNAANQIIATNNLPNGLTYDLSGNITYDGLNQYKYDGEGRVCAVQTTGPHYTGYVYDGEGRRVAKGNVNSLSCDMATNGFAVTNGYILGLGGEQVSETNGSGTWLHTNAFAGGKLLATYSGSDTYFALNDWLGTKRVQYSASAGGTTTFATLPFGDNLSQTGGGPDATEHHFTGKEHDSESGNDYFMARYYASPMGRFLNPDWSAKEEPVPYAKLDDPQSLNLYSYVRNKPLTGVDPDGHVCVFGIGNTCAPTPPPPPPSAPKPPTPQQVAGATPTVIAPGPTFNSNDSAGRLP